MMEMPKRERRMTKAERTLARSTLHRLIRCLDLASV